MSPGSVARALGLAASLLLFLSSASAAPIPYKIVTASERGTYIQIGRDLAKFVAPEADIALEVLPSKGSAENVNRLRYDVGVKFAIVQSDVFQAFLDYASKGNDEAGRLIKPLRVIMPLYNEEIYFLVRADSPLQFVHEIFDQRINVGPVQSGTAMTATTIYRLMYGQPMNEQKVTYLSNEDAMVKLTTDKSIDVVAIVAGQPAKLLADMKPEAKQIVRLLKVDPSNQNTLEAFKTYFPATIRSASYPNWLDQDVPGIAVKAFLVTYDYNYRVTTDHLTRFARSLCQNFSVLQTEGHPKWRDVDLSMPALGAGWSYYQPMERVLRNCARTANVPAAAPPPAVGGPPKACTQQERVLGLCQ